MEWRVKRDKNLALVFEGDLLVENTSKDSPNQPRWQEIRIYRTTKGNYVVERVGQTTVLGESVRRIVNRCETAQDVAIALRVPVNNRTTNKEMLKNGYFYTDLALEVLDNLEDKDPAFKGIGIREDI